MDLVLKLQNSADEMHQSMGSRVAVSFKKCDSSHHHALRGFCRFSGLLMEHLCYLLLLRNRKLEDRLYGESGPIGRITILGGFDNRLALLAHAVSYFLKQRLGESLFSVSVSLNS